MKKIFFLILIFGSFGLCTFADSNDKFISNFSSCTPYSESHDTEMFGMNVSSTIEILGRNGGKCGFKSSIMTQVATADIRCNFADNQIDEIISSMQNNSSEIESFAKQGLEANTAVMMENPAVIIFNKYLNDTGVCTVTN